MKSGSDPENTAETRIGDNPISKPKLQLPWPRFILQSAITSLIIFGLFALAKYTGVLYNRDLEKATAAERADAHVHQFGQWSKPETFSVVQYRTCTTCGLAQLREIKTVKGGGL